MKRKEQIVSAQSKPSNNKRQAFLLILVENWDYIMAKAGKGKEEAITARLSGSIHTHFGSDFESMTLNNGEFFVIVRHQDSQPLLESSRRLKHALDSVELGDHIALEVSICITARFSGHNLYHILLRLRSALEICRKNANKMLCVI